LIIVDPKIEHSGDRDFAATVYESGGGDPEFRRIGKIAKFFRGEELVKIEYAKRNGECIADQGNIAVPGCEAENGKGCGSPDEREEPKEMFYCLPVGLQLDEVPKVEGIEEVFYQKIDIVYVVIPGMKPSNH